MQLPDLQWGYLDFEDYILSEEAYMVDRTFYIDKSGKDVKIISDTYEEYLGKVQVVLAEEYNTIKVEGIERQVDWDKGTIHAFRYWPNSPSFAEHKDPVDVILEVKQGSKLMEVQGSEIFLEENDIWYIPANTPHRALNNSEGLMFSYGVSDTESN